MISSFLCNDFLINLIVIGIIYEDIFHADFYNDFVPLDIKIVINHFIE